MVLMKRNPDPPTFRQLHDIGISLGHASELAAGKKMPSLGLAKKIEASLGWPVGNWPIERERTAA